MGLDGPSLICAVWSCGRYALGLGGWIGLRLIKSLAVPIDSNKGQHEFDGFSKIFGVRTQSKDLAAVWI